MFLVSWMLSRLRCLRWRTRSLRRPNKPCDSRGRYGTHICGYGFNLNCIPIFLAHLRAYVDAGEALQYLPANLFSPSVSKSVFICSTMLAGSHRSHLGPLREPWGTMQPESIFLVVPSSWTDSEPENKSTGLPGPALACVCHCLNYPFATGRDSECRQTVVRA